MWRLARHEEGFRAAHSGGQVILNLVFSLCIKIDDAVLIALAVYDALPTDGVDGVPVQRDEFAYTHAGRAQQVDRGKVSGTHSYRKESRDFVAIRFPYGLRSLDSFNASDRAFDDMVSVFEP